MMRSLVAHALGIALIATLAACGGGGGGGSSTPVTPPATTQNVQPIIVDAGPSGLANILFTTVTICAPGGSTNCQTIDHIQVDTASNGLRIMSSVLSPALSLKQQTDAGGNPIVECAQFADGYSWGPVKVADIHIAGEQASSVPVHIIGDPAFPSVPSSCSSSGPPENTVEAFGANGVLGVGVFLQDCGDACAQVAFPGAYYSCPATGCTPIRVATAQQLQNPVSLFAGDNNGVIIKLPAIPAAGAATVAGTMVFGIGTQANNGIGSATVLHVDANTGNVVTLYNGQTYVDSYIDSGSNALFFGTRAFATCTKPLDGFYCPATTQSASATIQGTNSSSSPVNFSVANASQLATANPTYFAFSNLAGINPDSLGFAWGLPFHYGRNVATAIEGRSTPAGTGPYVAF